MYGSDHGMIRKSLWMITCQGILIIELDTIDSILILFTIS